MLWLRLSLASCLPFLLPCAGCQAQPPQLSAGQPTARITGQTTGNAAVPPRSRAVVLTEDAQPFRARKHRWQLMDSSWNLPAASVALPEGWGFAGDVVHAEGGSCTVTGTSVVMHAESRDGSLGILALPALRAQSANNPALVQQYQRAGCLVAPSTRAVDFLERIILPRVRPDARILAEGTDPVLEPAANTLKQQLAAQLSSSGARGIEPPVVSTARVRIAYLRDGRPVEEFVSGLLVCSRSHLPGMPLITTDCTADNLVLLHAPPAMLDTLAKHPETVSFEANPAWSQRLAEARVQYQQQQAASMQQQQQNVTARANASAAQAIDNIHSSAARGNAQVDMIHRIGNASMTADRQRMDAMDHSAKATAAYAGGYNVYRDPQTGQQVQLSDQYSHTYVNEQGTVAQQTNSASGPVGGGWWTEMVPKY